MSVILELDDKVMSQSFSETGYLVRITNSGNESIDAVTMKVDGATGVFSTLEAKNDIPPLYYSNCLGAFSTGKLQFFTSAGGSLGSQLPAATSDRHVMLKVVVKGTAPIQIHNFECGFTYTVY